MADVRQAIRVGATHVVDRAVERRPACDAQVVLDADGTVPYDGSIAIMCMRRGTDVPDEVDDVIAAVMAACWAT